MQTLVNSSVSHLLFFPYSSSSGITSHLSHLMALSRLAIKSSLSLTRTMTTIASLRRMSAKSLSEKILAEKDSANPSYAIIDVRDDGTYLLSQIYFFLVSLHFLFIVD
jgi:hypothetical protein